MAASIRNHRSYRSKVSSRKKRSAPLVLQKPHGVIASRVKAVGAEKFAVVCFDPAKHRSEWMMADYFGNLLITPETLEHAAPRFQQVAVRIRQAMQQHGIVDLIVTIERTGNYHLPVRRALAAAGFETRIIHPYAVKQYRLPADPGNKTDTTDLLAQHRAALAGFGLWEPPLSDLEQQLRLLVRHRRSLVENATALCCQIKEHLHLSLPGYARLFQDLWSDRVALPLARLAGTPQALLEAGRVRLATELRRLGIRFQSRTLEKVIAWARTAPSPGPDALLQQRLWTDLDDLRTAHRQRILLLEREIAGLLVKTRYVLLLAIPGINVVSAGDLAGEMGSIAHYASANAITGRAGLFPSRYQSDQTDLADGPLPRRANRRLRAALLRIADNLVLCNQFFRGKAAVMRQAGVDERALRVKIAKTASRLVYALIAGREPLRHRCCAEPAAILDKLRVFHLEHKTPAAQLMADLNSAVQELPRQSYPRERNALAACLEQRTRRRAGPVPLADLLPTLLARLGESNHDESHSPGETPLN